MSTLFSYSLLSFFFVYCDAIIHPPKPIDKKNFLTLSIVCILVSENGVNIIDAFLKISALETENEITLILKTIGFKPSTKTAEKKKDLLEIALNKKIKIEVQN